MRRFTEKQLWPVALACGMLLMMGWFTLTSAQRAAQRPVDADLTAASVPVLMYHHILPQADLTGLFADNDVAVSEEQLRRDLTVLKEQGYQTISLRQLSAFVRDGAQLPGKCVLITFDDGYLSNKIYAQPVLEELGYTAVIFVLTGWMEEHPQTFNPKGLQYLSWPEIGEMRQTFQFASHTDDLHDLSWNGKGKLTTVSDAELAADLQRSVKKLQDTRYFSYPYGHYTDRAREILAEQGMELAFTVEPVNVRAGDDPLTLGRWDMARYSIEDVLAQRRK